MLACVADALTIFRHNHPRKPQNRPYPNIKPTCGSNDQYAEAEDWSLPLSKEDKKCVHEVTGTLLYYSMAVDTTILTALSSIAAQKANPTEQTMQKVKQFLYYATTHPDSIITYDGSDMVLTGHSDVSYLSKTKDGSRAGGRCFMSNNTELPPKNGSVLTISKIIKEVMSSATEVELGALCINFKEAISALQYLEEMGYTQPPTPMQTDNTTAHGVVTNNLASKRLK